MSLDPSLLRSILKQSEHTPPPKRMKPPISKKVVLESNKTTDNISSVETKHSVFMAHQAVSSP